MCFWVPCVCDFNFYLTPQLFGNWVRRMARLKTQRRTREIPGDLICPAHSVRGNWSRHRYHKVKDRETDCCVCVLVRIYDFFANYEIDAVRWAVHRNIHRSRSQSPGRAGHRWSQCDWPTYYISDYVMPRFSANAERVNKKADKVRVHGFTNEEIVLCGRWDVDTNYDCFWSESEGECWIRRDYLIAAQPKENGRTYRVFDASFGMMGTIKTNYFWHIKLQT